MSLWGEAVEKRGKVVDGCHSADSNHYYFVDSREKKPNMEQIQILFGNNKKKVAEKVIVDLSKTVCKVDLKHESCSCSVFRKQSSCGHVVASLVRKNKLSRPLTLVEKKTRKAQIHDKSISERRWR